MGWLKSANKWSVDGMDLIGMTALKPVRDWWRLILAPWGKLYRLDRAERCLLTQALLLLPLTALALRCFGFRRLYPKAAVLWTAPGVTSVDAEETLHRACTTARMVAIAARNCPAPTSCLERSLTLWWLLHRQGIASELCLGVRKAAGQFEAHAWVECAGRVLNDRADVQQRFTVLPVGQMGKIPGVKS